MLSDDLVIDILVVLLVTFLMLIDFFVPIAFFVLIFNVIFFLITVVMGGAHALGKSIGAPSRGIRAGAPDAPAPYAAGR